MGYFILPTATKTVSLKEKKKTTGLKKKQKQKIAESHHPTIGKRSGSGLLGR